MIDEFAPLVDAMLRAEVLMKAAVIHERLVAEYGFTGNYHRVKLYVQEARPWLVEELGITPKRDVTAIGSSANASSPFAPWAAARSGHHPPNGFLPCDRLPLRRSCVHRRHRHSRARPGQLAPEQFGNRRSCGAAIHRCAGQNRRNPRGPRCPADGVLLLENQETFQVLSRTTVPEQWLCIWMEGYASDALALFLGRLLDIPLTVWGDLDPPGIDIIVNLSAKSGRDFQPVAMSADLYKAS